MTICADDAHIDAGGPVCASCGAPLPRVRRAIELRRRGNDGKTCLHRFSRGHLAGDACGARDGVRGAVVKDSRCGRHRRRERPKKELSRWQLLETD